jgi:hypothetical protein
MVFGLSNVRVFPEAIEKARYNPENVNNVIVVYIISEVILYILFGYGVLTNPSNF